ncbi:hypothetical protein HK097_004141 [Rhizophlyctis rosea]|uniref:PLP-dependent transferase n=1 Tax=Rhizophlyctis rosea TaxID=64517 RepID=A0AAD5X795_9FUNG|nr:hypothetical protein HK097_004141 [Rhizophlyctis rosea]
MPGIRALTAGFPTYQIFAANTGVGKTVVSTALCRAATQVRLTDFERRLGRLQNDSVAARKVFYLKPVQTGYPIDSDAGHVSTYCQEAMSRVLYTYEEPASPHLTALKEGPLVSDKELLNAVQTAYNGAVKAANGYPSIMFLETAGGVNSPVMSGTLQCNAYRPFRHPVILVGDSKLGGVSTTLSAYESLVLRGYDIASVLMFHSEKYKNHEIVQRNIDRGVNVYTIPTPPPIPEPRGLEREPTRHEKMLDYTNMMVYYGDVDPVVRTVVEDALARHESRVGRLESMGEAGTEKLWWPFTQHKLVSSTTVIDSAYGDYYTTYDSGAASQSSNTQNTTAIPGTTRTQFDACASWWTQGLGHGNPSLSRATAYAAGRYGHVIYPECVHEPALGLAEKLLNTVGKGWASRVFYSDDGSTATEIALKMALKRTEKDHLKMGVKGKDGEGCMKDLEIVGIQGSYHGDTIGAMDASDPNVYNAKVNWYSGRGIWFEPPTIVMKDGKYTVRVPDQYSNSQHQTYKTLSQVFSSTRDTSDLAEFYRTHLTQSIENAQSKGHRYGALIIEPIIMGAGGMLFVDPVFQRALIKVARSLSPPLPVIYDEVFTGIRRLGPMAPGVELLGIEPDIACYAKALTAGVVPLAVTLTSERVFRAFEGSKRDEALLHGHSFSAHPVGCFVAGRALEQIGGLEGGVEGVWDQERVRAISSLSSVNWVVALGTVLAVEPAGGSTQTVQNILSQLRNWAFPKLADGASVYARPLGSVVYIISSHVTGKEDADALLDALESVLKKEVEGIVGDVACIV